MNGMDLGMGSCLRMVVWYAWLELDLMQGMLGKYEKKRRERSESATAVFLSEYKKKERSRAVFGVALP